LWIYGILFFIIFAETGFVIFPFLPGDSLLFVAGALAAIGEGGMNIWTLIGVLLAAAVLGNMVNYQIGRLLGPKVFHWENSRFFNKAALEKTHAFYEKHGGKTLVISRFLPLFRTFAPFVAGIGAMSYPVRAVQPGRRGKLGLLAVPGGLLAGQHALGQAEPVGAHSRHHRRFADSGRRGLRQAQGCGLMRGLAVLLALILAAACSTKLGKDGRSDTTVDVKYLVKTEVDRIADTNRAEVVDGLLLIADKLYKRNPKEWKKAGQQSRSGGRASAQAPFSALAGNERPARGPAAALAFNDAYAGDRVAALVFGLLTMVDAAFEHKQEFYVLDSLNEIKLFNSRATWMSRSGSSAMTATRPASCSCSPTSSTRPTATSPSSASSAASWASSTSWPRSSPIAMAVAFPG
jgi:membrane protein YqaA with SNARE-associated domain